MHTRYVCNFGKDYIICSNLILLLSEIVRDDSDRERVDLKGQTRHTHLDMDGMEIDAEPETLVSTCEVDEGIAGQVPRPMDPIMTVMDILWRVEGILKEADTTHAYETRMRRRGGN